ncbi:MAG: hypothetical protein ABSB76_39925 [Streptosporangiaceae bacterium]|jgi:hypothetical protein
MQSAYFTSAAWDGAVGGGWPPRNAVEAAIRYAPQYVPGPELLWPFDPDTPPGTEGNMTIWITLSASTVGAAWLGSPWLRMQAAHSSSNWVGLLVDPVVVEFPLPSPLLVELPLPVPLLLPKLATGEEFAEPPLHAADSRAAPATMAKSPVRSDHIRRSLRRPPVSSFILCSSATGALLAGVHQADRCRHAWLPWRSLIHL